MLYVLGISGSPRRGGNSEILLDYALEGAKERGAFVEKMVLADLNILPCNHCDNCLETGECVIEDDMRLLYERLKRAERLIFSFPIYFAGLPAHAKAFVDRCHVFWVRKTRLKEKPPAERLGFWIAVAGRKNADFSAARATVKAFFSVCSIKPIGELLFPGIDGYQEVLKYQHALDFAFASGAKLAKITL